MHVPDLQALNRYVNTHYRVTQHALAWADEGQPAYDCKGLAALKIDALERAGVSPSDLTVLLVNDGRHVVLRVGADCVLDENPDGACERSTDYTIWGELPAYIWSGFIPQARGAR